MDLTESGTRKVGGSIYVGEAPEGTDVLWFCGGGVEVKEKT